MTQLILYSLAIAAGRHGVEVNAFCAMSTHIHMVVTDPSGVLPRFLRCFHQLVAMGTKIHRRWEGSVWDNARTSVVKLLTQKAIVETIAYTLANPVAAGIVRHAHEWPGAKNLVDDIGSGELQVTRPNIYFNPNNRNWPKETSVHVKLPPMIAEEDADIFRQNIAALVANEEIKARKKTSWKNIAGPHRAATISPYKCAKSIEPKYKPNPTFAVGHGNGGAAKAATAAVRSFRAAYRNALERWRAGDRNVSFPKGTWWMREFHAANVDDYDC